MDQRLAEAEPSMVGIPLAGILVQAKCPIKSKQLATLVKFCSAARYTL